MSYHYKSDGTMDMRFSSSKSYVASNGYSGAYYSPSYSGGSSSNYSSSSKPTQSSSSSSSRTTQSSSNSSSKPTHSTAPKRFSPDGIPLTKSGRPDMRFKVSKELAGKDAVIVSETAGTKKYISPPPYENDLKVRKDGYLCMTTKANKEYANLPRDSDGNVIQTSSQAVEFRRVHDISFAPSISFNFSDISPISYAGTNTVIRKVIDTSSHLGTKKLGKIILYHATDKKSAKSIMKSGEFRPGSSGLFGAAIYFADKRSVAIHKANNPSKDAIVVAKVNMGKALIVEGTKYSTLTYEHIKSLNCDTVLGRSSRYAEWEYVVYDPSRVVPVAYEEV